MVYGLVDKEDWSRLRMRLLAAELGGVAPKRLDSWLELYSRYGVNPYCTSTATLSHTPHVILV